MKSHFAIVFGFAAWSASIASAAEPIPKIARVLPPQGIEIPAKEREDLTAKHKEVSERYQRVAGHALAADVAIYIKAVGYALLHGEFYDSKDFAKAKDLLTQASGRIDELAEGKHSWSQRPAVAAAPRACAGRSGAWSSTRSTRWPGSVQPPSRSRSATTSTSSRDSRRVTGRESVG